MDHKKQAKNQKILVKEIVVKDSVHRLVVKQKNWNQIQKCLMIEKFIKILSTGNL